MYIERIGSLYQRRVTPGPVFLGCRAMISVKVYFHTKPIVTAISTMLKIFPRIHCHFNIIDIAKLSITYKGDCCYCQIGWIVDRSGECYYFIIYYEITA